MDRAVRDDLGGSPACNWSKACNLLSPDPSPATWADNAHLRGRHVQETKGRRGPAGLLGPGTRPGSMGGAVCAWSLSDQCGPHPATACPPVLSRRSPPGENLHIDGLSEQADWGRGDERAQACVSVGRWPQLTFQVGVKDLGTTPLSSLRYLYPRRSARISGLRLILYNFPKILSRLGNSSRALLMC